MLRAQDAVRVVLDLDKRSAPVEGAPGARCVDLDIIGSAPLIAEGADLPVRKIPCFVSSPLIVTRIY